MRATLKMNQTIFTIDAEGKKLGRVSTLAAMHLMGKTAPTFKKNAVTGDKVRIINASKISVDPVKLTDKVYKRYSGYPGGQTVLKMNQVIATKGYTEVFKKAIKGMLPANRLRPLLLKNLEIAE